MMGKLIENKKVYIDKLFFFINFNYSNMKLISSLLTVFIIGFYFSANAQKSQKSQKTTVKQDVSTHVKTAPRITTSSKPINNSSNSNINGVRGNDVIGEGQYLSFTKKIMDMSTTGNIPLGFPKHVKGQTKKQYVEVMKLWAKNNPDKMVHLPGEGQYLNFDQKIIQMSASNSIPKGFPKHKIFQSLGEYKLIMKNWAKQHPNEVKEEYKK